MMSVKYKNGFVLPLTVFLILLLVAAALASTAFTIQFLADSDTNAARTEALLAAEAGIEYAIQELNQTPAGDGVITATELVSNTEQGRVTYTTSVSNGSVNEKNITSIGQVYIPQNATQPVATRRVQATTVGTSSDSGTTVKAGQRLEMSNSSTVTNGIVRVNGRIIMSNSSKIGTAQTPVNVHVGNFACSNPSYPSACSTSNPITLNNSAEIYGDVRANNQQTSTGMTNNGLIATSGVEANPLDGAYLSSVHDRVAQKNAVSNTISAATASCTTNNGTKTWAANTKITAGTVTISKSCKVTVLGDVWIVGNLSMINSGGLVVGDGITDRPDIMIDGQLGISMANSSTVTANSSDTGVRLLAYYSTDSCNPNCSDVVGSDLDTSEEITTVNLKNSSLAPGASFYAVWSKVELANGGSVGSLLGQVISLSNPSNVTFGEELSSGDKVWTIQNYRRL